MTELDFHPASLLFPLMTGLRVCVECGRLMPRDQVFVVDFGPVCKNTLECWRAQGHEDVRPIREERVT